MRILIILSLIAPMACYGNAPSSCWLEGKIDGKRITLDYIHTPEYAAIYGASNNPIYGYCTLGAKDNTTWFMRCAKAEGGKPTVYYETNGTIYRCISGCNGNVVKQFKMECAGGD